jgi:hypothetical protein
MSVALKRSTSEATRQAGKTALGSPIWTAGVTTQGSEAATASSTLF